MSNGDAGQANLALVQRMYECFNRDDMDTIRNEIFARDLVWNLPGHHPLSGTKHGAEEVLAFFAALRRANIQVTLDPQNDPATGIDSFGQSTVVEVHRGRGTDHGARCERRGSAGDAERTELHALSDPRRPHRQRSGLHERSARRRYLLQRRIPAQADSGSARPKR